MKGNFALGSSRVVSWRGLAAVGLATGLLVVGCAPQDVDPSGGDDPVEPEGTAGDSGPDEGEDEGEEAPTPEEDEPDEAEASIEVEDGFWRLNTLPEPVGEAVLQAPTEEADGEVAEGKLEILSLDSDGDYARLIGAWLVPEDGPFLGSRTLISDQSTSFDGIESRPYMRLVDREAEEVLWPLHTGGEAVEEFDPSAAPAVSTEEDLFEGLVSDRWRDTCLCSQVSLDDQPSAEEPDQVELFYVDFPVPESGEVDVVAGQWPEPIRDVSISEGEPFDLTGELTEFALPADAEAQGMDAPPEEYGTSAQYEARAPLQARSRTLTGVTTTIEGETREVSLPADVLFEFGEYSLTGEAETIIEDAAEMLNVEAEGQTVTIEGHTDNVDGHDINQPLSENRADAVAEVIDPMLDDGITIETVGHSFDRPLVPNEDAEGEAIEENQQLNRRVSFRYTAVEETEVQIELGEFEELEELPEAESAEPAEGAVAAFTLEPPENESNQTEVKLDVYEAERTDETSVIRFGVSDPQVAGFNSEAFAQTGAFEGHQHFQGTPYLRSDQLSVPHLTAISLVDVENERQHFPTSMAERGCLCSESSATWTGLAAEPSPMFAEFELPEDLEAPVILRVPDAGEFELPEDTLEQLQTSNADE